MKRLFFQTKTAITLILLLSLLLSLCSCVLPSDGGETADAPYRLVYDKGDEIVPADRFTISDIRLVDKNDPSVKIPVTVEMIGRENLTALTEAGIYTLTVKYEGFSYSVTVMLREPTIYDDVDPSDDDHGGHGGQTGGDTEKGQTSFSDPDVAAYYRNADGKTGAELKSALRTIISKMTTLTYKQLNTVLQSTDAGNTPGTVRLFYTGKEAKAAWDGGSTWNKEHVWPQSQGWFSTSGAGSDAHHLRPCDPGVNSKRGNTPFGTGSGYYEPNDDFKGDCARIIFYLLTRYAESDSYSITKVAKSMSMLLAWNELDPVDSYEIARNEAVYAVQGNRNPFIDCPAYADLIWGK